MPPPTPSPWRALHPRYWPVHLLGVLAVAAALALGLWQLDAWQAHRAAAARDLTSQDAVPLTGVIGPDDPFPGDRVGQPVTVSGTWLPEGTFLVSGREHDGADGYWVVSPLELSTGSAFEVVRGWTATTANVPAPPAGAAELTAWLQPPEGAELTDDDPSDDVFPQLRIADAVQRVDTDLYGAYGVLDGTQPATNAGDGGLVQAALEQLPDAGSFTALRNLLYALEWWFFGLFAVYIWWRWLREEVLTVRAEESPTRAGSLS